LELDIPRVPSIQIPSKKDKILSFLKQISPENKSDGNFGNYFRNQGQNCKLRILKFYIRRVPAIQNRCRTNLMHLGTITNMWHLARLGTRAHQIFSLFEAEANPKF
jgi:hypothetical protein